MKIHVTESMFIDGFMNKNSQYKNNFSIDGLRAMFEHFENFEEDTDTELQFDVIAICCEWAEFENLHDFEICYGGDYIGIGIEGIREHTQVIQIPNSERFIIQSF